MTLVAQKIGSKTPKRILTLDGGGIRGALTLGYLNKIEAILRERYQDPNYKLCQYFDLIAGTSTGSIIATGLALGMDVKTIKNHYINLGKQVFSRGWGALIILPIIKAKYSAKRFEKFLGNTFKGLKLGDAARTMDLDGLKTGLCIFAKRVDTQSLWAFCNSPKHVYSATLKNHDLKEVVRASTAAPTYFKPLKLDIYSRSGGSEAAAFTDGGISMANNPSFMTLLVATIKRYGYNWPMGDENLLLISVGTGQYNPSRNTEKITKWWALDWGKKIPDIFMYDAKVYNEMIMQCLSESPTKKEFDRTMKDLNDFYLGGKSRLSYQRYDCEYSLELFQQLKIKGIKKEKHVKKMVKIDQGKNAGKLFDLGVKIAETSVIESHFPETFDI